MSPSLTPGSNAKYLDTRITKDYFQFPTLTLESMQDKYCIFKALSPLIAFGRFFVVFPVSWDAVNCRISHSWASFLPWLNLLSSCWMIPFFAIGFPPMMSELNDQLNGTSYYVFGLSILTQSFGAGVVYLCGNYNAIFLVQAAKKLYTVTDELNPKEMHKIKYIINTCRIYLTVGLLAVIILFGWNLRGVDTTLKYVSWATPFYAFFTVSVPDVVASIFAVFVCVVFFNFKEINDQLSTLILEKFEEGKTAGRIAQLRRYHETMKKIVGLLEKAFGPQVMAIFISASICFVTSLYTLVLVLRNEVPSSITDLGVPISIQSMTVSSIRLLSIILSCQKLVNEANRTKIILHTFDDRMLARSEDLSVEVDTFLKKHGNSPFRIVCCDVLEIGNSFLASGLSFVVTCILVLIQLNDGEKNDKAVGL